MNRGPKKRTLLNEKEQAEDFLEELYILQGKFNPLTREDICKFMDMTKWEYKRLVNFLMENEYISNADSEVLILTEHGKMQAMELIKKHHYLTDFLQTICKVDRELAEDNACRMEHVISPEIFCGITDYMKTGKSGDRNVHGWDINRFYEPGNYEFRVGIYESNSIYPRILCPDNEMVSSTVKAKVGDVSKFGFSFVNENADFKIWYRHNKKWELAEEKKNIFYVPTDIFIYTLCEENPMIEGEAEFAFIKGDRDPEEEDVKEVNVHLW